MNKNKIGVWVLVGLLGISSYINYRQYQNIRFYDMQKMNNIRNMYVSVFSRTISIADVGYRALATSDDANLEEGFNLIIQSQSNLSDTFRQHIVGFYPHYEAQVVLHGLNILTRDVIDQVRENGWTEDLRLEFEEYLKDYYTLSQYYKSILEIEDVRNFKEKIKEIELNIVESLNKYINYEGLRRQVDTNQEERNREVENYERNLELTMEMVTKFEPDAIEYAKKYMGKLIPGYETHGYEIKGVIGHGYSTSPPLATVTIGFVRKNIYHGVDFNKNINITLDGKFTSVDSYYSRRSGSSISAHDMIIKNTNITVEEAINITKNILLDLFDFVEDFELENYLVANGRLSITFNSAIDGIITNMNAQVTVALDDGRIENLYGLYGAIADLDEFITEMQTIDRSKIILQEEARKSIGKQNTILEEGRLFYRYDYFSDNKLLWRFGVRTGSRKQRIFIDAKTGEEVNIESYNWDF